MDKEQIIADILNSIEDEGFDSRFTPSLNSSVQRAEEFLEQAGWERDIITGAWLKP